MKKVRNHTLHFSLILIMLLISCIIVQVPAEKKTSSIEPSPVPYASLINSRIQSLVYTGSVDCIIDGMSRYFIGSMQEALTAFLHVECPLNEGQKSAVLFGLIHKLRKHKAEQALVCKQLFEVHAQLSKQPILYVAVTSQYSQVVKDIVRWSRDHQYPQTCTMMFDAFDCAIKNDDLKAIERLYLHGAYVTKNEASKLLKTVVCQNKKIEMAKFFIERTHADPYYVDDSNKSLLTYAVYHKNKAFIHAIKNGKKDDQGFIVALN